ncbi:uncharacterized protein LOC131860413 [Cryptomeria japonica]|uniref:uncharacterized protein LOC131860413 n=1 Tax=Cryptomeria japonica TaxID=3369 RepID=UPI0027DA4496|nr:uncharacterized protein LOC131860413 [Cryptomeria japonica]
MDWSEAIIPLGNQKIKLELEPKNKYTVFPSDNPKAQILFQECEFGNYLILALGEKKTDEAIDELDELWQMEFDGSCANSSSGAGVVLLSSTGNIFPFSFKLDFKNTNYTTEYEALLLGLSEAKCKGIKLLKVKEFDKTTKHIVGLLSEQHPFKWTEEAKNSFERIKGLVVNAPTLVNPDFTKDFILYCYASEHTMSGILLHLDENGVELPIVFMITSLKNHELKYSPMEKHAYAVVKAMK